MEIEGEYRVVGEATRPHRPRLDVREAALTAWILAQRYGWALAAAYLYRFIHRGLFGH